MLILGVGLAVVAFVAVLALGGLNQQAPPPPQDVTVVVAAADMPVGTQVSGDKLTTATRPANEADDTYGHPEDLVGRVVRRTVLAGQALSPSDFETSAAVPDMVSSLRPGMRAVAVPMLSTESIGSLLQPGDYVDVILSLEELDGINPVSVPNPGAGVPTTDGTVVPPYTLIDDVVNNTTVKVVVQNVQVLATMPTTGVAEEGEEQTEEAPPEPGTPDLMVMLAVTPQQAEVIRFAELDGNISLVLRAPADYAAGDVTTSGITLRELVDNWGVLPPQPVTVP
jgi:pilus assembly protein CpaB